MSTYEQELLQRIAKATEEIVRIARLWEADRQEAINRDSIWNNPNEIIKTYTANRDRTTK